MLRKILTLVLLCGVAVAVGCEEESPTEPDVASRWSSETVYVPVETVLVNEKISVPAGSYKYWELSLSKGAELYGEIASNSDINIWFLSPREFEAFENRETFHSHTTASRKRTLGFTFTYTIPQTDKYYFVAENRFSWFTSKAVSVYLTITQ